MVGTLGNMLSDTHADQLARLIATNYDGEWHILFAPAVVESNDSAKTFLKEPHIGQVLEMGKESDIALIGVGLCNDDALLARAGYLTSAEIRHLRSLGAVGEVGCRFFTADGQPCSSDIDHRTISIELEDLRKIPTKIGLAGGLKKVDAIHGALVGNYINVLVTDIKTATALLER
jgi:deoxyribonucleoside regulator